MERAISRAPKETLEGRRAEPEYKKNEVQEANRGSFREGKNRHERSIPRDTA